MNYATDYPFWLGEETSRGGVAAPHNLGASEASLKSHPSSRGKPMVLCRNFIFHSLELTTMRRTKGRALRAADFLAKVKTGGWEAKAPGAGVQTSVLNSRCQLTLRRLSPSGEGGWGAGVRSCRNHAGKQTKERLWNLVWQAGPRCQLQNLVLTVKGGN